MNNFLQDLRYGSRMLRKNPGFTAIAVVTLALGIGVNAAIFSMVNGLLLRPLSVKDPEQIAVLALQQKHGPIQSNFSYPDYQDIRRQTSAVFSGALGWQFGSDGLTVNDTTQPIITSFVTPNFFTTLGLKPFLGRFIMPSDGDVFNPSPVLVLGYSYWKSRFAGDPSVVGRTVTFDGLPITVIGVVAPEFHGMNRLLDIQGYLPLGMAKVDSWYSGDMFTSRDQSNLYVAARLRGGVKISEAQNLLNVVAQRLAQQYPKSDEGLTIHAYPERMARPEPGAASPLIQVGALFLILAALVLVLACVNVANLLLVRATVRQREMAIRSALGGSRPRLIRQCLTESLLLAFLGGLAGIVLGMWGSDFVGSINLQSSLPVQLDFSLDWRVLLYAIAAAALTGIIVGILPALRASGGQLGAILHDSARTVSPGKHRMRNILVAAQVGGSLMLLIVAGLFTRSLRYIQRADLGFNPDRVLNLTMDPHEIGMTKEQGIRFYNQLLERVRALAGVDSASVAFSVPMGYISGSATIDIPGYQPPPGQAPPSLMFNQVSPGYFATLQIPLLEGRDFTLADDEKAQYVVIVNQAMARRYWPNEDPLGHEFRLQSDESHPLKIVGVVQNSRDRGLSGEIKPYFYVPLAQNYISLATLQVRTMAAPETMTRAVMDQIQTLAPRMPMFDVRPMTAALNTLNGFLMYQIGASLAASLGLLGLILAVVGVYGVISYSVSQRSHEIGLRLALGATGGDILRMILRQGVIIIALGIAAGLMAAFAVARLVDNFLSGVSALDPLTYVSITLLLALVALLACFLPARRAMRVDPMESLRYE